MSKFQDIQAREGGLKRELSGPQITMIALGGAIGTGLFLGSRLAIGHAGSSVIISYLVGGFIAFLLMMALAEMTVAHPTTGSFGAYAEHFISPFAGYTVRYMYWLCIVLAVGTEVTAIGEYFSYWFPGVPQLVWVIIFAGTLIFVNTRNVKIFGTMEYWFSAIKVFAIVAFIVLAAYLVLFSGNENYGAQNWNADDSFFLNGVSGTWIGVLVAIFSYLSIEMVAVAAGEAREPGKAIKSAFRTTIFRLLIFYIFTLALIVSIAPVSAILTGGSPFVTVMEVIGIPYAGSILNFIVIVAALSAMNSQLYISTRMMFSLSRAGQAPALFGKVRENGAPVNALLMSTLGIVAATLVYLWNPDDAFTMMLAISMFGAMFTWLMIFVTHIVFRHKKARDDQPLEYSFKVSRIGSWLGALAMLALLVTTILVSDFRMTLIIGIPSLILVGVSYIFVKNKKQADL